MAYFDTKDKKRGLIGTILVHLILLILFAIYGLTYPTPRPESGMLLNLGSTAEGSGEIQPDQVGETAQEQPVAEDQPTESNPSESSEDQAITQDQVETIEVPPKKDPVEKEKTIDNKLKNALENAFDKKSGGSEGDDKDKKGDKGKAGGDKNGNSYTGGAGGSGGGNYSLGNRSALEKIKPDYQCEEYGIVVISIRVDRTGKTLNAKLQLKGSTNTAPCLVNKAKDAAMKTKWQPDTKAPEMQIGSIAYHFDLN
tara:strand:- start:16 stop:777 length:762 start_codon:yes stop_codon:yes gene_type:complete